MLHTSLSRGGTYNPDVNKMGCVITNIWTLQTWTETGKNLFSSGFVWLK